MPDDSCTRDPRTYIDGSFPMRRSKYTKELLLPVVRESKSLAEVLRRLDLRPTGGNYRMISTRLRVLEISTEHVTGRRWARGQTAATHPSIAKTTRGNARSDEEVFVENSPEIVGTRLVRRLLRLGWDYRCTICGIDTWQQKPLTLHLDHINGIRNDNRFENLRFLCPNCHQQTETWGATTRTRM